MFLAGCLNTLSGMASTPLTLAALATSAVSGLQVTGYRELPGDENTERSVLLESSEGDILVQLPTSPAAEVHHSAKILGQSALTAGVREQLPFDAPQVLGMTRNNDTRAIVSTYVHGDRFDVEDLEPDSLLIESIASTLSTIHALPVSIVVQQGLRTRSPNDARLDAKTVLDRAYHSGLLPETIHQHWNALLSDIMLWDFQPVVIHGSIDDSTLLVADDVVVGVLDWAELSTGDPAVDFAWLAAAKPDVLERTTQVYAPGHADQSAQNLVTRARFWHELKIAEWLLHGIEHRDQSIIDDAVELFDQLISQISARTAPVAPRSSLATAEAASRPDSVPETFSDTASFDMLDEDRSFTEEREFFTEPIDPLQDEADEQLMVGDEEKPAVSADAPTETPATPEESEPR